MPLTRDQRRIVEYIRKEKTVRICVDKLDLELSDDDRTLCHDIAVAIQGYWRRRQNTECRDAGKGGGRQGAW